MEVRVVFKSELYINGKDLEEIRKKWEDLPIFSADALEKHYADFIDGVRAFNTENGEEVDL